tara:strand:+ start:179 stop:1162 length:984 start_codon:yes stop_codon:yes gene_type:complete
MALNLNSNKFKSYKEKASNRAKKTNGYYDDRFISFEAGKKYKFRLLWFDDESPETNPDRRDGAFLETYIHSAKDDGGKRHNITCPTSFDQSAAGFKSCKCCETASSLYKSGKEGSKKDEDLYSLYKRKFHGYALVYVVSDGSNPENNGKVKMMHYSIRAKKFFDAEIYGIEDTWNKNEDEDQVDDDSGEEEVGFGAFQIENGYDLIVTVKKNGKWNDYNYKFARNASDIEIDERTANEQIKALDFDGLRKRTPANEIENFYTDVMLGNSTESSMIDTVGNDDTDSNTTDDEINQLFNDDGETSVEEDTKPSEDDNFDVDEFLKTVDD